MNRFAPIAGLGLVLTLSSCGPLQRIRTGRAHAVDSAVMAITPAPDMVIDNPDSPMVLGPFPDTLAAPAPPGTPELADDSEMAMPWWLMQLEYATFSGKAKARYDGPEESRDFSLSVRIESGKRIWMSVVGSALGISVEVFRAVLTPDSMIAVNRIDKEVIRAPFGEISRLFPVEGDFYTLEAILIGNRLPGALRFGEIQRDTLDGNHVVQGSMAGGIQTITYRLSDSAMVRQHLSTRESATVLSYDEYQRLGDRRFSGKRHLAIESGGGTQTLDIEYTSFSFDEPVDMSITIPPKYKQR